MEKATFQTLKKGDKVRLKTTLGKSKHFVKGAVLEILKDYKDFATSSYIRGSYSEVKILNGVHLTNYYSEIYPNNIELLSEEELKEMNKASKHITNIVGTTEFLKHSTEAARDTYIQKALTSKPDAQIAVYTLTGLAEAVPVEVKFTIAKDLSVRS